MRKILLAICSLVLLGTASAAAADSATCIRRNDIRAWASPVRKQLVLENYARHRVLLKMNGTCDGFGVYDSFQITGLMQSNASCIVTGDDVLTNWGGVPGRCSIVSVEPYAGPFPPPKVH